MFDFARIAYIQDTIFIYISPSFVRIGYLVCVHDNLWSIMSRLHNDEALAS